MWEVLARQVPYQVNDPLDRTQFFSNLHAGAATDANRVRGVPAEPAPADPAPGTTGAGGHNGGVLGAGSTAEAHLLGRAAAFEGHHIVIELSAGVVVWMGCVYLIYFFDFVF